MEIKKKYIGYQIKAILFVVFCIAFSAIQISAQGNLMIFPKRVVFDNSQKVQEINLSNIGKDTAVYNVSFVQFRMSEVGDFKEITVPDSGQNFATPYLRVFPRRVVLAPNESQTVKVQVTKTNELEPGEYRSHIYFRAVKNIKPLGDNASKADSGTISVKLEPVFGISIACIIRKGESNTVVSISDLEYDNTVDSVEYLKMNFHRTGNMSTYGDITVNFINNENKSFEVGKIQGFGVYTPGNIRKCKMKLKKPIGVNFNQGKFNVVYTVSESKKVLTEAELTIKE